MEKCKFCLITVSAYVWNRRPYKAALKFKSSSIIEFICPPTVSTMECSLRGPPPALFFLLFLVLELSVVVDFGFAFLLLFDLFFCLVGEDDDDGDESPSLVSLLERKKNTHFV